MKPDNFTFEQRKYILSLLDKIQGLEKLYFECLAQHIVTEDDLK